MKQLLVSLFSVGLIAVSLISFTKTESGSIKGVVAPAEAIKAVWIQADGGQPVNAPVQNGVFEMSVAAGSYKVSVEAQPPYANWVKEGVVVAIGQPVDLGAITLVKQAPEK